MLSFMGTYFELFNQGWHCQNFTIPQCIPLPLLRRETFLLWPPMAIPLVLLPPDLASASPQYPEHSETSISISITPLGVILPSFLLPLKEQFLLKSPLARLPMLQRPPTTSTPSSLHPSPQIKFIQDCVVKKKKPLLSARYRKRRLVFALKHRNWAVEDWKRVIWSDETKINRFESDGRQLVWKQKGEGLIQREVQGTVKFDQGNIMI